jgi:hypothetical protein
MIKWHCFCGIHVHISESRYKVLCIAYGRVNSKKYSYGSARLWIRKPLVLNAWDAVCCATALGTSFEVIRVTIITKISALMINI